MASFLRAGIEDPTQSLYRQRDRHRPSRAKVATSTNVRQPAGFRGTTVFEDHGLIVSLDKPSTRHRAFLALNELAAAQRGAGIKELLDP